jgi:hypothetical protein
MSGAKDVTEAAYTQFATFDRNIWEGDGVAPFAQVYVNRTPQPSGVPLSAELKGALLHASVPVKIFVTGQKGSGKSMELRPWIPERADATLWYDVRPLLQPYIDRLLDEEQHMRAIA